ncbi:ATP-binding protein [Pseudobacteriovorax antillogorgiicola]|uniref:Hpt domain-containing protein n=1 Tax=Pseudobacteriovorax antillogorgiicola TaxID=1513793 RepID=A0A1Y6CEI2_9BACT|nr:ATP-binding protein [Pseudobacteriovorax antillogorgiicola]TCS48251.1 Hpt domain-containing protein [Pseudobacteriovorax antillogorgiicola]SMF57226.1 Hpt domain-containing protein [Pseudobacteriovorax antillogorgiicola]
MTAWIFLLALLTPCITLADTSLFHKISVYRFAEENHFDIDKGVADIRGLNSQEITKIYGEILFVPETWVDPHSFNSERFEELKAKSVITRMNQKTYNHPNETVSAHWGTYLLKIKNDYSSPLGMEITRIYHPQVSYIVTGNNIIKALEFGNLSRESTKNPEYRITNTPLIQFETQDDFYLISHVSSKRNGSNISLIHHSMLFIGDYYYLRSMIQNRSLIRQSFIGCFLILAVFYGFIWLFRRSNYSSFLLSLYAFSGFTLSLLYSLETNQTPSEYLNTFTAANAICIGVLQQLLLYINRSYLPQKLVKRLSAFCLALSIITVISIWLEILTVSRVLFVSKFALSIIFLIAALVIGFRNKITGLSYLLMGITGMILFQAPLLQIYTSGSETEQGYYILTANFCMVLSLALANAKEFSVTYRRSLRQQRQLKEFNHNLESLVDEKTREVRSLFDHIPQGVLSIRQQGLIGSDYSAHLKSIIEHDDIEQKSFKDEILCSTDLSGDRIDQIWQTILLCIGERDLNFEVNADKFPSEFGYNINGKLKFLKATWNYQASSEGVIQSILVTLLDVTSERILELETTFQRIEMNRLQELANVPTGKAEQFFSTSEQLLQENERLILGANIREEQIKMLFVNAHTIKGAARTLHLTDLAKVIHHAEEHYSEILRGEPPNMKRLQCDIEECKQTWVSYKKINEEKLNRLSDIGKVKVDREFIEQHYYFLKSFISQESILSDSIIEIIHKHTQTLTDMIFEQLPGVFEEYKNRAIKIARDLDKEEPNFDVSAPDLGIPSQAKITLDQCMIHLLRNSLDHGIESIDERKRANKSVHGTIKMHAKVSDGLLEIHMSDDGRGMALDQLKETGIKKGILNQDSTQQEIAESVFHTGVSTAQSVSEISGRGVGMEAVRRFLDEIDGSIQLVLGLEKKPGYYDFEFIIKIPVFPLESQQLSLKSS